MGFRWNLFTLWHAYQAVRASRCKKNLRRNLNSPPKCRNSEMLSYEFRSTKNEKPLLVRAEWCMFRHVTLSRCGAMNLRLLIGFFHAEMVTWTSCLKRTITICHIPEVYLHYTRSISSTPFTAPRNRFIKQQGRKERYLNTGDSNRDAQSI